MVLNLKAKSLLMVAALLCALPAVAMHDQQNRVKIDGKVTICGTEYTEEKLLEMKRSADANDAFIVTRQKLDENVKNSAEKLQQDYNEKSKNFEDKEKKINKREQEIEKSIASAKRWTRGTDIAIVGLALLSYDQFLGSKYCYKFVNGTYKLGCVVYKKACRTWKLWFPAKPAHLKDVKTSEQSQPQCCCPTQPNVKPGFGGTDVR